MSVPQPGSCQGCLLASEVYKRQDTVPRGALGRPGPGSTWQPPHQPLQPRPTRRLPVCRQLTWGPAPECSGREGCFQKVGYAASFPRGMFAALPVTHLVEETHVSPTPPPPPPGGPRAPRTQHTDGSSLFFQKLLGAFGLWMPLSPVSTAEPQCPLSPAEAGASHPPDLCPAPALSCCPPPRRPHPPSSAPWQQLPLASPKLRLTHCSESFVLCFKKFIEEKSHNIKASLLE